MVFTFQCNLFLYLSLFLLRDVLSAVQYILSFLFHKRNDFFQYNQWESTSN